MVARGFTDPRYAEDVPSLTRLAEACGMHTSTISSAVKGTGRRPSTETVVALVRELGDDVAGWLGVERVAAWTPPAEAALLTERQALALEELIRAMTEPKDKANVPAPNTQAAGSAATTQAPRVTTGRGRSRPRLRDAPSVAPVTDRS